jgi:hypothetical protein
MNAVEQIDKWIADGKPYNDGVAIYAKYGFSLVLKNLFAKGPNNYNTDKLDAELLKLLAKHQHLSVKPKVKKAVRTKSVQKDLSKNDNTTTPQKHTPRYSQLQVPGYNFNELPEQLKYEWQLRIKLFKEAESHHYRLDTLQTEAERKKSVDIILQNFDKIDELWDRLDYWGKHGIVLPEVDPKTAKKTEITDPLQMAKRRNNLRSYITKGRKKITLLKDNQKISELNQKIAHWEIEKDDLDRKIQGE